MSNKESPSRESTSSSARMSSLIAEDSLTRDFSMVSLTSTSSSQEKFFCCRDHAESILKRMQSYLENQQLCDVVLIAGIDGKR